MRREGVLWEITIGRAGSDLPVLFIYEFLIFNCLISSRFSLPELTVEGVLCRFEAFGVFRTFLFKMML